MSSIKRRGLNFYKHDFSKGFEVSVYENDLTLGTEIKGDVRVKSDVEVDIEKIWVKISCIERIEKDTAILFNATLQVLDSLHVDAGFDKEFPFVYKLPSVGRETYHSIHQNVQWLLDVWVKIKQIRDAIKAEGSGEIFITKPSVSTAQVREVQVKEVVREVVLIPCAYCSGLMPQTSVFCPNCGARRKC